ncbi:hypothetical protein CEXT_687801 [Caerostris extrusa]|uniref:Uncharacterized protein n=1 Tax=Caerostris extrusa TaxID=172846 RepID=A0AAV4QT49_CAEEX|nr:hypothetical protein CEXT_687801 [Caerostris extrusa]
MKIIKFAQKYINDIPPSLYHIITAKPHSNCALNQMIRKLSRRKHYSSRAENKSPKLNPSKRENRNAISPKLIRRFTRVPYFPREGTLTNHQLLDQPKSNPFFTC